MGDTVPSETLHVAITVELEHYVFKEATETLRAVYDILDADQNGRLDKDEIVSAVRNNGVVRHLLSVCDKLAPLLSEDTWRDTFAQIDTDGSGSISLEELQDFCTRSFVDGPPEIDEDVVAQIDEVAQARRHMAALQIQSHARRNAAKRQVSVRRTRSTDEKNQADAATRIQRQMRRRSTRRILDPHGSQEFSSRRMERVSLIHEGAHVPSFGSDENCVSLPVHSSPVEPKLGLRVAITWDTSHGVDCFVGQILDVAEGDDSAAVWLIRCK